MTPGFMMNDNVWASWVALVLLVVFVFGLTVALYWEDKKNDPTNT